MVRVAYTNRFPNETLLDDPPLTLQQTAAANAAQPKRIRTYSFRVLDADGALAAHRRHALGTWLKAAMTLRILDERPGVTDIRTGQRRLGRRHARDQPAMGYRPLIGQMTWELPVERASAWLATRTIG